MMEIRLTVNDPELEGEIAAHAPGAERERFLLQALRIGIVALRHTQARLDADLLARETDRLLSQMGARLGEYFDPKTGRFTERVQKLAGPGGELDALLTRSVTGKDSAFAKMFEAQAAALAQALTQALERQVGPQSPLFKHFSTDEGQGFLKGVGDAVRAKTEAFQKELARQFSLDDPDSALSRLVANVEKSNRTITTEFSLDDPKSALSRFKREVTGLVEKIAKENEEFRRAVTNDLSALIAKREEAEKSTRHGLGFEAALNEWLVRHANRRGDLFIATGSKVGLIKNCKIGDAVIQLSPESKAAGERIVIEAKESQSVTFDAALEETETARKNRDARVGIFVYSAKSRPANVEPFRREGDCLVVVWDAEDPTTDVYLEAALSVARALCVRSRAATEEEIDKKGLLEGILNIEKQIDNLAELSTYYGTIATASEKGRKRIETMEKELRRQLDKVLAICREIPGGE